MRLHRRASARLLAGATALCAAAALIAVTAAPAPATTLLSDQQRVSASASAPGTQESQLAYNSKDREFLAVFTTEGANRQIWGRRVTDLGTPIGDPFPITGIPAPGEARQPAVAYSRKVNGYLIAFVADPLTNDDEFEIWVQRVDADGGVVRSPFRVSQIGADGDDDRGPLSNPSLTYNDDDDQFLVAWDGDHEADEEFEIFAQRIGATGNEIGPETAVSATPGADRDALAPAVAYDPQAKRYLVAWQDDGFSADDETDVFGQLLNPAAVPVGGDDFRISETGVDGNPDFSAFAPSVAADARRGGYMVAFSASLALGTDLEVKVQGVDRDGAQTGPSDARISEVGPEGAADREAVRPRIAYNPAARQFLVSYAADDLAADDEYEAFVQRLSKDGEERGESDLRVSSFGPEGNADFGVGTGPWSATGVASNGQLGEWLVGFYGDEAVNGSFNAFVRRVGLAAKCGGRVARVGGPGRDLIKLSKGRDVIAAKGGRDNVRGQGGKDRICGGKGKDRLSGGKGRDRLLGQKGKDRCLGGKGRDRAKGCERTGSI